MTDAGPSALQVRRRLTNRRRVRRRGIVVLVALLALLAAWVVVFSPVLSVRQVKVDGASIVSADDVQTAAAVPIGRPMAQVHQSDVASRITNALPAVLSATVSRQWPSTLVIHVTERTIAYQVASGGGFGWVSDDGVVFNVTPDSQAVPLVDVATGDPKLLTDVATVVKAIPAGLMPNVQSMSAATRDSITLQLDDGRQVVWGSADQSALKAQVIVPLLNVPGTVYDVSSPSTPAVR